MASLTLRGLNDRFPEGTSLGAYLPANWSPGQQPTIGAAPAGSAAATATVSGDAVTFTGLADDTAYVVANNPITKIVHAGTQVDHGSVVKTDSNGQVPYSKLAVLREEVVITDDRYGAVANDQTKAAQNDAAFAAAVAAIASLSGGGTPSGGVLRVPRGKWWVSAPITLGNAHRLAGAGADASQIVAHSSFSGAAMVANQWTDGTQQDAHVENLLLDGNNAGGATSGDGILFDSLFFETHIKNVKTFRHSGHGIHLKTSAAVHFGGAQLDSILAAYSGGDQIFIDGAFVSLDLANLDVEHMAAGFNGLHIANNSTKASYRLNIRNLYSENGIANAASIWLEGVSSAVIDGLHMGGSSQTRTVADGVTNGTTTVTSATAAFAATDVNAVVVIPGSGPGGSDLVTTIASRTNATTVVLATAASDSASGKSISIIGQAALKISGTNQWATNSQAGSKGIEARNFYSLHTGAVMVNDLTRGQIVYPGGSPSVMSRYNTESGVVLGPPTVPPTNTTLTNPYPIDVMVYIFAGAGGGCGVTLAGAGFTNNISASEWNSVRLPAGSTIKLTYTAAPTWKWISG